MNTQSIRERHPELFQMLRAGTALALAALLFIFAGCENTPTEVEDYVPQPELTAYIHTGEPVTEFQLTRVGGFYSYYDPLTLGISHVSMKMFPVLDADGSPADTAGRVCYFEENPDTAGYYRPVQPYIAEPMVRYRVVAKKASEKINLWAETTVPDTFSLETYVNKTRKDLNGDTLSREDPEIFFRWSSSATAGGYQLGILALTEDRSQLLPLDPSYDPNNQDMVDAYENVPRYGYTIAPNYQLSITLAWLYMTWAGPTRIDAVACSQEYFDYIFSRFTIGGNENPLMNVHGGIGIFGAVSRHSVEIYMKRTGG